MSPRSGAEYRYRPAWWLPGPHAQTLWGRFARSFPRLPLASECLATPDGDNLEIHSLAAAPGAPRVLLLHGLEGSARSHYVGGVLRQAHELGWGVVLLVSRGCGTTPNVARRFYHSGETSDLQFAFAHFADRWPDSSWSLMGFSLGGNVLLKWLGELGKQPDPRIRGAAAVSVPFDLEAGSRHIGQGFARVYDRNFLKSLRRKAIAKLVRYPDLFDRAKLDRARSIYAFDDAVTAPVHGFADAHDYYTRSSSLAFLSRIRVPTLLLSAKDDPFLPREVLERVTTVAADNPHLTMDFREHGGHVGFVAGMRPWSPVYFAEWRAFRFLEGVMERR